MEATEEAMEGMVVDMDMAMAAMAMERRSDLLMPMLKLTEVMEAMEATEVAMEATDVAMEEDMEDTVMAVKPHDHQPPRIITTPAYSSVPEKRQMAAAPLPAALKNSASILVIIIIQMTQP